MVDCGKEAGGTGDGGEAERLNEHLINAPETRSAPQEAFGDANLGVMMLVLLLLHLLQQHMQDPCTC